MSSTRKPVIVRKLSQDWWAGYASAALSADAPALELLLHSGKLLPLDWEQVKWVCYLRELPAAESSLPQSLSQPGARSSSSELASPERLLRRRFLGRPRISGLWLRLALSDGDELEGVAANDRSLIGSGGILLTPPDTRSNTQRVFVPHSAIRELTVLGVIGPAAPRARQTAIQPELFDGELRDDPLS